MCITYIYIHLMYNLYQIPGAAKWMIFSYYLNKFHEPPARLWLIEINACFGRGSIWRPSAEVAPLCRTLSKLKLLVRYNRFNLLQAFAMRHMWHMRHLWVRKSSAERIGQMTRQQQKFSLCEVSNTLHTLTYEICKAW